MNKSFAHQFYEDCQLTFALFKDVKNAKELRQSVMKGEFEATLLKPCMISDSFRKFGLGDSDTGVFIVIINDKDSKVLSEIKNRISGTELPVEDCKDMTDNDLVKKIYKVTDLELSSCSLEDALVSRIASKELYTV